MAKAFASEALPQVGADALQVHGGLGYTWEHDVQLYYKRLLTLEQAYGNAGAHLDALADIILPGTARRRS
jgi:alkylation response protein AidB-like acyl-CoA dehydrogenase